MVGGQEGLSLLWTSLKGILFGSAIVLTRKLDLFPFRYKTVKIIHIVEKDQSTLPDDVRSISLETLPNVNLRDPSHDINLSVMSVTGSINQNVFKSMKIDGQEKK